MRQLIAFCVVVCVVLAAGFASAANPGQVPHNTLSKMGLADLQPMSDVQGSAIRGKFAVVSGYSYVNTATFGSGNKYAAGGPSFAAGASLSVGGQATVIFTGSGVGASINGLFAGGGAIAVAR